MFIAYRSLDAFPHLEDPIAEFVGFEHFTPANGYDDADRAAIAALLLGESWTDPRFKLGHAVTRVPSAYPPVGARVTLRDEADWSPDFMVSAGATGTVVQSDAEMISVKLDEHVAGAEEWENCIQWYPTNMPGSLGLFWQLALVEGNSSAILPEVVHE